MENKRVFTKDNTLGEVLDYKEELKEVLAGFGMHCFGCPMTRMETLEQAAQVHGVDLELLIQKINENA